MKKKDLESVNTHAGNSQAYNNGLTVKDLLRKKADIMEQIDY